jgi:hypothetical protein
VIFAKTLHSTGFMLLAIFGHCLQSKKKKQNQKTKTQISMKKFIYVAILLVVSAMSVTSCTEQEVKPRDGGSGGSATDPKG